MAVPAPPPRSEPARALDCPGRGAAIQDGQRTGLARCPGVWVLGMEVIMRTIGFVILALGLLAVPLAIDAQQVGKVYRIGFLRRMSPEPVDFEAFRQGLREL